MSPAIIDLASRLMAGAIMSAFVGMVRDNTWKS